MPSPDLPSLRRAAAWAFLADIPRGGSMRVAGTALSGLTEAFTALGYSAGRGNVDFCLAARAEGEALDAGALKLAAGGRAVVLLPAAIRRPATARLDQPHLLLRSSGPWATPVALDPMVTLPSRSPATALRNRRRGWALALGDGGIAALPADLAAALGWERPGVIRRILIQRRGSLLVDLRRPPSRDPEIVRVAPYLPESRSLARRQEVLDALRGDRRLPATVATLIPRAVARATVRGAPALHMEGRSGSPGHLLRLRDRDALRADVSRFVRRLDEALAEPCHLDDAWLDRLVSRHVHPYRSLASPGVPAGALDWLDRRLRAQFAGRTVPLAPVHGDLDETNVIADPVTGRLLAVVDWECAESRDLPGSDLAYYELTIGWPPRKGELGAALGRMLDRLAARLEFGDRLDAAWIRRMGYSVPDLMAIAILTALRITAQDLAYRGAAPALTPRESADVRDIARVARERLPARPD